MEYIDCCCCGRKISGRNDGSVVVADGSVLCEICVRRIRFMFPVPEPEGVEGMIIRKDPMSTLTADTARNAVEQSAWWLDDLRKEYGYHEAVFRVDMFSVEKQGLLKPPKNAFGGYVLYGRFDAGDTVRLIHRNNVTEFIIEDVQEIYPEDKAGEAGYASLIFVTQKGLEARAGDLIVKD